MDTQFEELRRRFAESRADYREGRIRWDAYDRAYAAYWGMYDEYRDWWRDVYQAGAR
jgi:hypothetical protein